MFLTSPFPEHVPVTEKVKSARRAQCSSLAHSMKVCLAQSQVQSGSPSLRCGAIADTFLAVALVFLTFHAPFETFKYIQVAGGMDCVHLDSRLASALGTQAGDRLPGRIEGFQKGISPHSLPQVGHHLCRKLLYLHSGMYTN